MAFGPPTTSAALCGTSGVNARSEPIARSNLESTLNFKMVLIPT